MTEELITDNHDHMKMEYFIETCKQGAFIDYDGFAEYANETHILVDKGFLYPSDILAENFDKTQTYIVWYNK